MLLSTYCEERKILSQKKVFLLNIACLLLTITIKKAIYQIIKIIVFINHSWIQPLQKRYTPSLNQSNENGGQCRHYWSMITLARNQTWAKMASYFGPPTLAFYTYAALWPIVLFLKSYKPSWCSRVCQHFKVWLTCSR